MSSKREFVIIYPRDDGLSLLPVWVSHWKMDYLVEFWENAVPCTPESLERWESFESLESLGYFSIATEFYDFRVEKDNCFTSMRLLHTGDELFRFVNDELLRLLEFWDQVTHKGADRILITIEDGVPHVFAKYKPRSPRLISVACTDLYPGARGRQMVGKGSMFTVADFFLALPEEKDEELKRFVRDKKVRKIEIANFVLTKKLWKIAINYKVPANVQRYERMLGSIVLLQLLEEFRAAMATKPEQIAIARDSRRLMVITDKTAEKLLFWK